MVTTDLPFTSLLLVHVLFQSPPLPHRGGTGGGAVDGGAAVRWARVEDWAERAGCPARWRKCIRQYANNPSAN